MLLLCQSLGIIALALLCLCRLSSRHVVKELFLTTTYQVHYHVGKSSTRYKKIDMKGEQEIRQLKY